jgi:succinate-acetate transporter protein
VDATDSTAPQPQREVADITRVMLRPIGSSLPLGFLALGGASVLLSGLQLRWLPVDAARQAGLVLLVFAVPAQLLASVFGFLARDGVGGTGMSVLAGTWLAIAVAHIVSAPGKPDPTLGLLLFFSAAAIMVPTAAASLGKVLAAIVLFLAASRFALTGIYEFLGGASWRQAAGWLGVALAVVALYAALAFEIEDTARRTVLPVLRWGTGRTAIAGGIRHDVERISREAGVREQL